MARKYKTGKIRERNREIILAAAELEFARHGFRGATIQNIAETAQLPKSNVLYYFSNKTQLYVALLQDILARWNQVFADVRPEDDPAQALTRFIHIKVELSRTSPMASRMFATEVIQGAPYLQSFLRTEVREWVRERVGVIQQWIDQGRMAPVDPVHLIFLIWSSTQHYADFQAQILIIEDKPDYTEQDFAQAAAFLTTVILRACGLEPVPQPVADNGQIPA